MPRKLLPYVNGYKDRTGKMRYYLRREGRPNVPISGMPGSPEFVRSYAEAIAGQPLKRKRQIKPPRVAQGVVYYLEDGDHIKIGFTIDWQKRSKAYMTHSATPPKLLATHPGTQSDEYAMQQRFKQYRTSRRDWFLRGAELLSHIEAIAESERMIQEHPVTQLIS